MEPRSGRALSTPRLVGPEDVLHRAADLAHRAAVLERLADRVHEVVGAARGLAQLVEALRDELVVAVGLERRQARRAASRSDSRVDAQDVLDLDRVLLVLVDADDDVLLEAVALLVAPGRLVDLVRDELDRVDRAAELVDLRDQLVGARLDLVGQRLDVVGARERVDGVGRAGLVRDDLLGAQRDLRGALATAARAPRRSRWCAATACRRRPRRSPAARRARRCSAAAGRSA